jgi:hypothetical protein
MDTTLRDAATIVACISAASAAAAAAAACAAAALAFATVRLSKYGVAMLVEGDRALLAGPGMHEFGMLHSPGRISVSPVLRGEDTLFGTIVESPAIDGGETWDDVGTESPREEFLIPESSATCGGGSTARIVSCEVGSSCAISESLLSAISGATAC